MADESGVYGYKVINSHTSDDNTTTKAGHENVAPRYLSAGIASQCSDDYNSYTTPGVR